MQSNTTLKRTGGVFLQALMILGLFFLSSGRINAQVYVNGNLSTGPTSSDGTAAPAGFNWSEVQTGNTSGGYSASIAAGFSVADDFTVPAGTWTLTKLTVYAYSTGYAGATSPFTDVRVRIFNTNPSTGTPTPIFGDLTTNRFAASSSANLYRIFNGMPNTDRQIWQIEANVATALTAGTYWVEWQVGTALTSNFSPSSTVVGSVTQPGNNALQHTLAADTWAPIIDGANPQDMPFRLDYTTSACTGTPAPGNTVSSSPSACPGIPFTLSVQNGTAGSGVTYQWQSSPDGVTFTNIPGATSNTYTTTLTTAGTYYQAIVTCGGASGTSTPVQVTLTPSTACYCTSVATNAEDEDIFNVTIGTLNNTSTCTSLAPGFGSIINRYSNYTSGTGAPAPGDIISGGTNPFSVEIGTCGGNFGSRVAIWIDFNQSGSFDAAERVYFTGINGGPIPPAGPHTETGQIFIPSTAINGITRMRVVNVETANAGGIQPCGTYGWGETEDYLVNIQPCTPLNLTGQPSDVTVTCGGNASFTVSASGDNPVFTWEYRTSPTDPWQFVTNNATFSGANTGTLTITAANDALDGYQFRAVYSGSCTATDFSDVATLTVDQLVATVNPTSATICNGGTAQLLAITNSASASTTLTFSSGALGTPIPDGTPAGIVSGPIAVSGIPAGSVISNVSVTFNITHTWVGDLDINLIAPNTEKLNLVGALDNGTGSNGTENFTNTTIDSLSTTPISGAPAPRTGTFAAEKRAGYGPAGNEQTVASWNGLLTVPNGDWRLAIADFFNLDTGTLDSWSVSFTYSLPVPATGIWSPVTGLYQDPAATIPYTGAPTDSVYAAPTTSTDYTVIVNTGTCTSAPLVVPVTVANPAGAVTQPVNISVCGGSNTTFTADVAGGPSTYQWQVSTDGGATWTDVTDGGVYSGATTNTLTLTNVPFAFNNNQYRLVVTIAACTSTATSNAATLTVNSNPAVTISAAPFTTLYPGLTTVLSANLDPAGTATYQWFLNGDTIPGATSNTYEVGIDGLGDYSVTATSAAGCSASSTDAITISDSLNTSLFIYPNPNSGVFQVRFNDRNNGVTNPRSLTVYDSKGSRVFTTQYTVNTPFGRMSVDMSKQPKGVYVIDLTDGSGRRLQSERVIIF